ncbi:MAG TPA: citramalate synthase [Aggregatilineales bacterium]|nr:citramalate synthase [Aggregatilineales bacterium]
MTAPAVEVYDTTLRDGTQREGISLSVADKLKVTRLLDDLGVKYIEGGWPGSNPKDAAYFEAVKELELRNAKITAFGMTCRVGGDPADDANIKALLDAHTPVVTVVGKTSMLHVTDVLRTTPEENLRLIEDSVAYLKTQDKEVIYDAEHFFDGYKLDDEYSLATLQAAVKGGADAIVLCDTNGGSMFWEVEELARKIRALFPTIKLGIHTHNDGELGVANTLAAVRGGATHVQGTINGYGERCGNANLVSIIADLQIKMGIQSLPDESGLKTLAKVSRAVAEIANLPPDNHAAYVGKSAFAHKGGIHVAAVRRNPDSYQHIDPTLVGNEMRFLVSDLSGRGNIISLAENFGIEAGDRISRDVLEEVKRLESEGYVFEGAEASVAVRLKRAQPGYIAPFELLDFVVLVQHRHRSGFLTEATIKLRVGNQEFHTVADGNGPVNALDMALRKALLPVYPKIGEYRLTDYKVRILDGEHATGAITRVIIDTQNGHNRWSTVGANSNIIVASWHALADSIEYGLTLDE